MGRQIRWILTSLGILSLIVLIALNGNSKNLWDVQFYGQQSKTLIETPRGFKTYKELDRNVYQPLGYQIREESFIPALDYIQQPVCSKIFVEWLAAGSETQDESAPPPKEIPPEMLVSYTLNNYTQLIMAPFSRDERSGVRNDTWTEGGINHLIQLDVTDPALDKYDGEGRAVYYAMKEYSTAIAGKTGAVIGSVRPWVEIYALKLNASHVTTMEYMKIKMEHPKMTYAHPVEVAKDYSRYIAAYDWIATFSSLEHSGLGRYGDALDPMGDLKESLKMYCMLKRGGYLFYGTGMGYDTTFFNWHRIYGRIRLALMFSGFDFIDMFYRDSRVSLDDIDFKRGIPNAHIQPVAVLRKR